jgi:hypothetical protein
MEVAHTSKMSVKFYWIIWHHISEESPYHETYKLTYDHTVLFVTIDISSVH